MAELKDCMSNHISLIFVDDEEGFVNILASRLCRRGIDTTKALSATEAIQILRKKDFDVVVLDVRMPGMDGIQTLREIKRSFPLIEVVMLTAHASMEVAAEGMELGAFDYLMKPVDIDDLVYKLEDAFKQTSLKAIKIKNLKRMNNKITSEIDGFP